MQCKLAFLIITSLFPFQKCILSELKCSKAWNKALLNLHEGIRERENEEHSKLVCNPAAYWLLYKQINFKTIICKLSSFKSCPNEIQKGHQSLLAKGSLHSILVGKESLKMICLFVSFFLRNCSSQLDLIDTHWCKTFI